MVLPSLLLSQKLKNDRLKRQGKPVDMSIAGITGLSVGAFVAVLILYIVLIVVGIVMILKCRSGKAGKLPTWAIVLIIICMFIPYLDFFAVLFAIIFGSLECKNF